jgi:protein-tyrosine phosphatase
VVVIWKRKSLIKKPETAILMVCMGNICRSPIAEGVLRARLRQAGLLGAVEVDSAGTHGYHRGEPPDPRAIRHAAQRGYDISGLRARAVQPEDYARFQWLLAMDDDNMAWLRSHCPVGATCRAELLMSFSGRHAGANAVPDPYYGGPAGFEHVLDLVEGACDGLIAHLSGELAAR